MDGIREPAKVPPIKFDMLDASPHSSSPYRRAEKEQNAIDEQIREMLKNGIIKENDGEWGAPCFCVIKKNGQLRLVIDYRKLNDRTAGYSYPLPKIDECLDKLSGMKYFASLDLYSGFNQIPICYEDQDKTGFVTKNRTFKFTRMGFGLKNAASWFQNRINNVLKGEVGNTCLVYIDDVIVYGRTFDEMMRLERVFKKLRDASFKMNPAKCRFGKKRALLFRTCRF